MPDLYGVCHDVFDDEDTDNNVEANVVGFSVANSDVYPVVVVDP